MMTVGIGVRGRVVQIVGNAILLVGVFLTIMPFGAGAAARQLLWVDMRELLSVAVGASA